VGKVQARKQTRTIHISLMHMWQGRMLLIWLLLLLPLPLLPLPLLLGLLWVPLLLLLRWLLRWLLLPLLLLPLFLQLWGAVEPGCRRVKPITTCHHPVDAIRLIQVLGNPLRGPFYVCFSLGPLHVDALSLLLRHCHKALVIVCKSFTLPQGAWLAGRWSSASVAACMPQKERHT
jgi:hypothetical protein